MTWLYPLDKNWYLPYSILHFTFSSPPWFQTPRTWIFFFFFFCMGQVGMNSNFSEHRILGLGEKAWNCQSREPFAWLWCGFHPFSTGGNSCRLSLTQKIRAQLFRKTLFPFTPTSWLEISSTTVPRNRQSTEMLIQHTEPESGNEDT